MTVARARQEPDAGDSRRRQEPGEVNPAKDDATTDEATTARRSPGTRRSTPDDAAPTDPFSIASAGGFKKPSDGRARIDDPDLDKLLDDELDDELLFEWTTERAGAVVRAGGYVLHTADAVAHLPGAEELWKATEADARAAGEPLARILNRYDSARRLAGMVDEAEFAAAMFDYARRNLRLRGAVVRAAKMDRGQPEPARRGADAFENMAADTRTTTYRVEPEPEPFVPPPPVDELDGEDPSQPEAFAFDPWAPAHR